MEPVKYDDYSSNVPPPPPEPTRNTDPDVIDRLCEYDPASQIGCRRTQTIFALEAEFDTFVHPEMKWGYFDEYCEHEGKSYYYKEQLTDIINKDTLNFEEIKSHPLYEEGLAQVVQAFGRNMLEVVSFDNLTSNIRSQPRGMPKLLTETPHFFECEEIGSNLITADMIDRTLLDKIKNTFTDDINPLMTEMSYSLYIKDDSILCANLYLFGNNPTGKFGFFMTDGDQAKFFAFSPLTEQQKTAVGMIALAECPDKTLTIVDL